MFDDRISVCLRLSLKETMMEHDNVRTVCDCFIPTNNTGREESIEKICDFLIGDWNHQGVDEDMHKLQTRVSMCEAIHCHIGDCSTRGVYIRGGEYLSYILSGWLSCHARLWLRLSSGGGFSNHVKPSCRFAVTPNMLPECKSKLINLRFNGAVGTTSKEDMMTHLLNKGLPKRCQIRELSRFMKEYMSTNPELCVMVNRMMLLSLCGLYPHCEKRSPFWAMMLLVCRLHYTTIPMLHPGQTIWLFVIREYIIHAVRNIPPLRSYLCKQIKWSKFEKYVISSMDSVRCLWSTELGGIQNSDNLEVQLEAINKFLSLSNLSLKNRMQQLRLEYCRCMVSQNTTAVTMPRLIKLITAMADKCIPSIDPDNPVDLLQLHKTAFTLLGVPSVDKDMMSRLEEIGFTAPEMDIIANLMRMIQCKDNISNAGVLINKLLQISIQNTLVFQHALRQTQTRSNLMLIPLPTNVKSRQLKAISLAMQEIDATSTQGGTCLVTSVCAGMAIFCLSCKEMKSVVVPSKQHTDSFTARCKQSMTHSLSVQPSKHTNHGSTKIIVDADTNTLHCDNMYLDDLEHGNPPINKPNTIESRVTKMYCSNDSIRAVNLIGKALLLNNTMYILCINCARITVYNDNCMNLCTACHNAKQGHHKSKQCAICGNCFSTQLNEIVVAPPLKGDIIKLVVVCDECKHHLVSNLGDDCPIPSVQQCVKLVDESKTKEKISVIHRVTKRRRCHI